MRFLPAGDIEAIGYARAVSALEAALRGDLDPSADPARSSTPVGDGASIRYMPSITAGPILFKSSGMAWEDLVVAQSVVGRA